MGARLTGGAAAGDGFARVHGPARERACASKRETFGRSTFFLVKLWRPLTVTDEWKR